MPLGSSADTSLWKPTARPGRDCRALAQKALADDRLVETGPAPAAMTHPGSGFGVELHRGGKTSGKARKGGAAPFSVELAGHPRLSDCP